MIIWTVSRLFNLLICYWTLWTLDRSLHQPTNEHLPICQLVDLSSFIAEEITRTSCACTTKSIRENNCVVEGTGIVRKPFTHWRINNELRDGLCQLGPGDFHLNSNILILTSHRNKFYIFIRHPERTICRRLLLIIQSPRWMNDGQITRMLTR